MRAAKTRLPITAMGQDRMDRPAVCAPAPPHKERRNDVHGAIGKLAYIRRIAGHAANFRMVDRRLGQIERDHLIELLR
jgi:hypothetical protein